MTGVSTDYDAYWNDRDPERAAARSRRRARIALGLLGSRRGRLLEVGCGPGWALETFRDAGFEVVGLDVSPVAVERARERGLTARVLDIETQNIGTQGSPGGFDVVVALEVLEHVTDSLGLLNTLRASVRPGGHLVISLPNELTLPRRLAILLGRPGFGGHDDPHVRHYDTRSARRLLDHAGLNVLRVGWDGICPPRWHRLKTLSEPLARCFPGLLAISGVYLIGDPGPEDSG